MMKKWIRLPIFCCITIIMLFVLNGFVFVENHQKSAYEQFYLEEENTLDLVCIGNSTVQQGINNFVIWENYSITSYSVCDSPTHPEVIIIALKEIARLQSPKVIYVDLNGLTYQSKDIQEPFVADYFNSMPLCDAKNELLIQYPYLSKYNNTNNNSRSLFKNHNAFRDWDNWVTKETYDHFGFRIVKTKSTVEDVPLDNTTILDLPTDGLEYLYRILETCQQYPDIQFVFGKMPRFFNEILLSETYMLRSAIPIIQEYGYTYVEWDDYMQDMNLNKHTDYSDQNHLNVYGSIKFTNYFIEYLDSKYNLCGAEHSDNIKQKYNDACNKYKQTLNK